MSNIRSITALMLAASLTFGTATAPAIADEANAQPSEQTQSGTTTTWKRLGGADRYKTMALIVDESFKSSDYAVITTAESYPDALAAAGLAGTHKCPIILTSTARLNADAKAELRKLNVRNAYIVGGPSAISTEAEKEIVDMGIKVTRIAGTNRQETSILVMHALRQAGSPSDTLIIASGHNFCDALSISPWAYKSGSPILLTNEAGMLSDAEVAAIKADGKFKRAIVIGNDAAVSDNVASQISGIPGTRIGGKDAYETCAKVCDWSVTTGGLSWSSPVVTTAENYPDALAGSVLAGSKDSVLLVADDHSDETLVRLRLHASSVSAGYLLGGENVTKIADPLSGDPEVARVRNAILAAPSKDELAAFGGFNPSSEAVSAVAAQVQALEAQGYHCGFLMLDLSTGKGLSYNPDELYYGASSIKAPYFTAVVESNPEALESHKALIQETLLTSSDEAYKDVLADYGSAPMQAFVAEAGARSSIAESLPWASFSARDLALMWGRAYTLFNTNPEVDTLGSWCSTPNVSSIHAALSGAYPTRSKAGWVAGGGEVVEGINHGGPCYDASCDGGIVYAPNGTYVLAIMSNYPGNPEALNGLTLSIDALHTEIK